DLTGVVAEPCHHRTCQAGRGDTPIMRAQRQPNRIQAEIGTAAFVGDRKAIAADSDFALAEDSKTDASGTDDHDSTVVSLMRTEAGNRRVIHVFHTVERMRA